VVTATPIASESTAKMVKRGVASSRRKASLRSAATARFYARMSLPLALEAARKWRYEPTLLNGAPVPVILTATVNFR
jgi:hypothetical protein